MRLPLGLNKRGIPGVNSDAYHLGYFEDTTGYKSPPPTHSRFDPLLETLYIFGAMVIVYTLFTFICFSLREYLYSLRIRKKLYSSGTNWSTNSAITIDQDPKANKNIVSKLRNPADLISKKQRGHRDSTVTADEGNDIESFNEPLYTPLDIVDASADTRNDEHESPDGFLGPVDSMRLTNIYDIKQLLAMRPAEYDGAPLTIVRDDKDQLQIEGVLNFTCQFTPIDFTSGRTAEKTVAEIRKTITDEHLDKSSKLIQVFRLVVIASDCVEGRNPIIFLKQFNLFMDELIDSGLIFELLNDSNSYFARYLIQMVLQYCFCHWFFAMSPPKDVVRQFMTWKGNFKPEVQPRHAILRYLVNLQLGFSILDVEMDTLNLIKSKVTFLVKRLVKHTHCADVLEVIKLLSQANEVSVHNVTRRLFYDLLQSLVAAHSECCEESLFQTENIALKYLIRYALWGDNRDYHIKDYCKKVYSIALSKNENIQYLWRDKEVPQDSSLTQTLTVYPNTPKDMARPGSWK